MVAGGFFAARGTDGIETDAPLLGATEKTRQGEKSRRRPLTQKGAAHGNVRPSMAVQGRLWRPKFKETIMTVIRQIPAVVALKSSVGSAAGMWTS